MRVEPGHGGSASGSQLEPLHHPSFETSLPQITPGFGTGWGHRPTRTHAQHLPALPRVCSTRCRWDGHHQAQHKEALSGRAASVPRTHELTVSSGRARAAPAPHGTGGTGGDQQRDEVANGRRRRRWREGGCRDGWMRILAGKENKPEPGLAERRCDGSEGLARAAGAVQPARAWCVSSAPRLPPPLPPALSWGHRNTGTRYLEQARGPPPCWQPLSPWQPPISPAALAGRSPTRSVLGEIRAPGACLGFSRPGG